MVGADGVIAGAYFSIPLAILSFVRKRGDPALSRMAILFSAFICACGTTHAMDIWTIWRPDYGLQALTKTITAGISLLTAVMLWPLIPKALRVPAVQDLQTTIATLKAEIARRLSVKGPETVAQAPGVPRVVLMVGVNGTGKTTTTAKLAARATAAGKSVVLAAADTFRAAAVEQLEVWATRLNIPLVKHKTGGDPAAVVHDACAVALSRKADLLYVDTAGRLHTKHNLMEELSKIRRIAARSIPGAPHEVLLVLDAVTGMNGIAQAREFTKTAGVTGLVLTKMDGTARGGVILAIVRELALPVRYVGVGETADDLLDFDAEAFAGALVDD
jgi:fused signal recognition particle receptor